MIRTMKHANAAPNAPNPANLKGVENTNV